MLVPEVALRLGIASQTVCKRVKGAEVSYIFDCTGALGQEDSLLGSADAIRQCRRKRVGGTRTPTGMIRDALRDGLAT